MRKIRQTFGNNPELQRIVDEINMSGVIDELSTLNSLSFNINKVLVNKDGDVLTSSDGEVLLSGS